MDASWKREANGSAPSFGEFMAAERLQRQRFVEDYLASRGLAAVASNRAMLERFLDQMGGARGQAQDERALDALIRVQPERLVRTIHRGSRGHV